MLKVFLRKLNTLFIAKAGCKPNVVHSPTATPWVICEFSHYHRPARAKVLYLSTFALAGRVGISLPFYTQGVAIGLRNSLGFQPSRFSDYFGAGQAI